MERKANAKLKILYVKDILEAHATRSHAITMRELLALLYERGVPAERKSVSDDLRLLQQYGLPVRKKRCGRATGYFLEKQP